MWIFFLVALLDFVSIRGGVIELINSRIHCNVIVGSFMRIHRFGGGIGFIIWYLLSKTI